MAAVLGGKGKILMDRGLAGRADLGAAGEGLRGRAEGLSRASRSSATSTATTRSDRSRPASRACWPHIRRSTASSRKRTAPAPSRRCRMPAARWCRSPRPPSTAPPIACLQTPGAKCILGANPPYLSAEAIKLAVDDPGRQEAGEKHHPVQLARASRPTRRRHLCARFDGREDRARQERLPGPGAGPVAAHHARPGWRSPRRKRPASSGRPLHLPTRAFAPGPHSSSSRGSVKRRSRL